MAKPFTKSPKTSSNTSNSSTKNGEKSVKFDKQSKGKLESGKQSTKKKNFLTKTVKISSLESLKDKKFGDNKNRKKFDSNSGEKRALFLKTEKGKMGNFNKQSRGRKIDDNDGSDEKGKLENGKKIEWGKRIPIKVSSFEKMKMRRNEDENGVALLGKLKRTKKMNMKISRYDDSNKRRDDNIVLQDSTNQKKHKKDEEGKDKEKPETVELSANAQFRAITPSPSIIKFVQDNLLGRRRDIELKRAGYNTELSWPLDNLPFSTSSERAGVEETLFRNKLEFFAAAKVSSSFPPRDLPEIAFAGRSNVGKSSLLNALTRQWGVVRTSDKPGHTQTINFFKLGTKLNMVDLPGYGFAYAKDEVKEAWEDLVKEYVSTRVGLKRVCLLIDTKWGMKPRDIELIHLMERYETKYQIVLTKTDVVFPIDVARRAQQIEETLKEHKSVIQPVMMVSSKSGAGIRCLRTVLGKMARFVKP